MIKDNPLYCNTTDFAIYYISPKLPTHNARHTSTATTFRYLSICGLHQYADTKSPTYMI